MVAGDKPIQSLELFSQFLDVVGVTSLLLKFFDFAHEVLAQILLDFLEFVLLEVDASRVVGGVLLHIVEAIVEFLIGRVVMVDFGFEEVELGEALLDEIEVVVEEFGVEGDGDAVLDLNGAG